MRLTLCLSFYPSTSFPFLPLSENMAASRTTLVSLVVATMLIELAMAASYNVGGPNGGWDSTTDLQTWASSQTFLVGDNLNFQYAPSHDVVEVSKADYDSCQASNSIQSYSGGSTTIPLSSPGKRYFICGTSGHCSQGMKLEVDTLATSAAPTASPLSPPPQESPSIPAPSSLDTPLAPETSTASPAQSPQSAPTLSPALPSELPISPASNPIDIPSTEAPTSISRTGSSAQPSSSSLNCKLGSLQASLTVGFSAVVIMLFLSP
ncbi:blue copper protein-like [Prunus avium]|uniref:Blue copper protein-like n=1 Tax=Prunus avium TaxID=42229 RepID=A0A6P5S643_PRUAV|nr:blue copper protein-like [Prunus avium]